MQRKEDNSGESVDGAHLEEVMIDPDEYTIERQQESILKPKRRIEAGPSETNGFGRKLLFRRHDPAQIGKSQEATQALLDEFTIQDDVKMYRQLPRYGDFSWFRFI